MRIQVTLNEKDPSDRELITYLKSTENKSGHLKKLAREGLFVQFTFRGFAIPEPARAYPHPANKQERSMGRKPEAKSPVQTTKGGSHGENRQERETPKQDGRESIFKSIMGDFIDD